MTKQRIQELLHQQEEARHSVNKESYYYTETISTNHTVTRFNQGKYDQDMAATNARINDLEIEINSLRQQEAAEEQARQRAISEEKARLEAIEQEKQQKIAAEQARLDAVKHGNDVISANISKQQKANFDMFQSLNSKQRAFFLSELFG
ncbi:MAG: hypothetical protein ACE1S7_08865, partial [Candidatus Tisiphia sp.]